MKIKAVIFDLDGTLLNTLDDLADSVNCTMQKFGFPTRTIDEVRNFVGNGVGMLIKRSMPEGDEEKFQECLSAFREDYSKNMRNKTAPYDGIIDLIKSLREKGMKIAVVSNKFDGAVKELCDFYFKDLIDKPVGESEKVRKKPAPDSVLNVLECFNIEKHEAVYVGDSDVDMDTAKNAGVKSIGVTWGFRSAELLKEHGADYTVNKPCEILNLITEGED